MHWGAYSDGDSGCYTSEDDYHGVRLLSRGGGGGGDVGRVEVGGGKQWGHLPQCGHAAHVPLTDVLLEGRRPQEHLPVCRHVAEGKRQERRTLR